MPITDVDFEKSDDELLLELADLLLANGLIRQSGPLDDKGKRERAKLWWDKRLGELKGVICGDSRVVAYLKNPSIQNRVEIAGVVVDCLTAVNIGVPVGTLAILVVKGRLQNLCA